MSKKNMFVSSLIDLEAWDAAQWKGTAFLYAPDLSMPAGMGLIFRDEAAARRIFAGWHDRLGRADERDELRVSIIEGEIPGEESGYTVNIGSNIENVVARAREAGHDVSADYVTVVSRFNRMNPPPESKNLEMFKRSFEKFGYYGLMPVIARNSAVTNVEPLMDLAITKRSVLFRRVEEIGENDVDYIAIKKDKAG